ncbi:hypothetical protein [Micromonospora rhizosphaerae]|uniref:hypothetical protein n=1 Tax=Micromonospora rhizosphaerae TaxID=568872 RepID=UPI001FDF52DC|nr:hypothetical protein [Micromonospora rhizosphaerae]
MIPAAVAARSPLAPASAGQHLQQDDNYGGGERRRGERVGETPSGQVDERERDARRGEADQDGRRGRRGGGVYERAGCGGEDGFDGSGRRPDPRRAGAASAVRR